MDNVTSIKALLSQISPKGPVLIKGRIGKLNPGGLVHIIVFNNSKVFYVLDKV